MDLRVAHELARAAQAGADDYLVECRLLLDHGHTGRATALAVLGQEEVGKALYFHLVSIGAMRLKRDSLKAMFRNHRAKQSLSGAFVAAAAMLREPELLNCVQRVLAGLFDEDDRAAGEYSLDEMRGELEPRLLKVQRRLAYINSAANFIAEIDAIARRVQDKNLSLVKESGLYVGLAEDGATVLDPRSTPMALARKQTSDLEMAIGRLREIFPNDLDFKASNQLHSFLSPLLVKFREDEMSTTEKEIDV